MFLLDGKPLSPDVPFTGSDGTQYPANWLRLASQTDRKRVGIIEEADPPIWDQRWAWGYDSEGKLIWKDHAQLIEQWTAQTKDTSGLLLSATDWMVIRELDNGTEMPADTKALREEIRVACNEKIASIVGSKDTEALASYLTGGEYYKWPPYAPAETEGSD
jgi:hypothetical protein